MAAEPQSVLGELATCGWAKETNFGKRPASFTGGVWLPFKSWSGKMTTQQVGKAPRASLGGSYPATGGRSGAGSLDIETDPDTFPIALAYALGKQTFHASDPIYTGTISGSGGTIGSTSMSVTSNSASGGGISSRPPLLFPGMQLTVDTSTNSETITLLSVTPGLNPFTGQSLVTFYLTSGSIGSGFTKSHSTGTAVTGAVASKAINLMTMGNPLPTFTQEINRPYNGGNICTDYLGCKFDSLAISLAAKQGLTAKGSLVFQDMQNNASPATASLSNLNPYVFEQQFVNASFCGETLSSAGAGSSLVSLSLTLNNNLLKDNHVGGNGNLVWNFPEQIRSVTGSIVLGFETMAEYTAAEAAASGGNLPPVSLLLPLQGTDFIIAGLPYSITLYLPKVFLGDWTPNDDTSKTLTQTLSITCAESVPGAGDNLSAYCITGASAIY